MVNELVKWIPLTDQRDRLKEGRDDLESAKLDALKHQTIGRGRHFPSILAVPGIRPLANVQRLSPSTWQLALIVFHEGNLWCISRPCAEWQ